MTTETSRGIGLAVVLGLFGFLVATGFIQERLREERIPAERAELERLVESRRETIRGLSSQVAELSKDVSRAQGEAGEGSDRVGDLAREVRRLEGIAGVQGVTGPGVLVELSDSERQPRTRDELTDLRIQDLDLQLVVNALWAAGAEAITVNGRRLVSTSAIRKAGSTILVNYRAVSSPYRVAALGDSDTLHARLLESEIAERFDVWRDVYGLGFRVDREGRLFVPGVAGLQELRYARPARGAS